MPAEDGFPSLPASALPAPPLVCERCRIPLAFGLPRSAPSLADEAYFRKFRATGSSGKDDWFLFLFGEDKHSQV